MRKRPIGKTGLSVTMLGYGASPLGNLYREVSDQQAAEVLEAAWNAGIRYFDTAPFYGLGLSEQRVGAFLSTKNRSDYVLSTKVGRLLRPTETVSERYGFINPLPNDFTYDYSYDGVMKSVESSLYRLGVGAIDIVLMHDIGRFTHGDRNDHHFPKAMSGGYRAMDELRRQGVVKAIGLGVNEVEVCLSAMNYGYWDCFLLAGRYTLLEQSGIWDFLPRCMAMGSRVIIGGVYNSGILATGTKAGGPLYYNYETAPAGIVRRVEALEAICEEHGVNLIAAALQFPLAHPAVCCVIPGMGNPKRIASILSDLETPIPPAFWLDLKAKGLIDANCPTPSGGGMVGQAEQDRP